VTTPHNHVLIDYENVQPEVASRLAPGFFKVWVFVGALQHKVKFDLLDLVQAKGGDAKVIRMGGTGPNGEFRITQPLRASGSMVRGTANQPSGIRTAKKHVMQAWV